MLSGSERLLLIALARDAILAHVTRRTPAVAPLAGAAAEPGAVFVSLHHAGALRGCIGHLEADRPLGEIVARCAVSAASEDPRFPAVTADEVDGLEIELSVLGVFERVASRDEVIVGVHGLLVEHGARRGLLLPQVAVRCRWHAATFIEQTCHKAGLPRDAWPGGGATLWKFEAEVFGEPTRKEP
jgi:AmmeMemoRadiSam system protein A